MEDFIRGYLKVFKMHSLVFKALIGDLWLHGVDLSSWSVRMVVLVS